MHATYEHSEGWFPVIGVTFERFFEMIISVAIVALSIIILVYIVLASKKCIAALIKPAGILFIGLALHTIILATETFLFAYHTIQYIPLSWYPITALTVIPMTIDIPRQGAVWFLLAYCAANGWTTVYGICHVNSKTEKKQHTEKETNTTTPQINASEIRPGYSAQMFTGMRIDIHL
jgi:hypothetical protein